MPGRQADGIGICALEKNSAGHSPNAPPDQRPFLRATSLANTGTGLLNVRISRGETSLSWGKVLLAPEQIGRSPEGRAELDFLIWFEGGILTLTNRALGQPRAFFQERVSACDVPHRAARTTK
jgi:hypothetical protein